MKRQYLGLSTAMALLVLGACSPQDVKEDVPLAETPAIQAQELESSNSDPIISDVKTPKRVTKTPMPDWVSVAALPEFPENRLTAVKNGIAYLATDERVYLTDDGFKYFTRVSYEIMERKGLEGAAQITRDFDPELQSLSFHYVNITRNGRVENRLADLEIQELQREDNLGSGIVDGDITAMIQIEDVKVGDIVDFGYSGTVRSPLWEGHYFNTFATSYTVPLARKTFEVSVPRQTRLMTDTLNTAPRPKITDEGDRTIYHFESIDAEPYKSVSNVPERTIIKPFVLISTMSAWEDVSDWAVDVYDVDMTLPKSFNSTIKGFKKSKKSPKERMIEAFRFVQSDIRYLGIESGVNSHKPRTPAVTLSKGYGDCKDKSLLLISALKSMGITAYPALVSTGSGQVLDKLLPSIGNFNHVIVMAELDGKTYWLDPTLSYQGGAADDLAPLNYGYVLPIKKGQTKLVKMDVPDIEVPTSLVTEIYVLPEDTSDEEETPEDDTSTETGMTLDVVSIYVGADADSIRRKVARTGLKDMEKNYLDYYADLYPGLTVGEGFAVADDFDANKVIVSESYLLSNADYIKNELADGLIVKASTISGKLPTSLEADREIPLGLAAPLYLEHIIEIKTPGRNFIAPERLEESQSGVTFVRNYRAENETLYVEYMLKIDEKSVGLADARAVIELADTIATEGSRTIHPKAARQSLSTRLKLDFTAPVEVENQLTEVAVLLQKKENVQALEILNNLEQSYTKKDALRGYIQNYRAAVTVDLGRKTAAAPMFEEAFSLYDPDTSNVYFSYAGILRSADEDLKSANIMRRLFENHPEAAKTVNYDWLWRLMGDVYRAEHFTEHEDFVIALAAAQLKNVDDIKEADQNFEEAILVLGRRGDVEAAKAYFPYLKTPSQIRDILIDKELEVLWPDVEALAGEGLRISIDKYVEEVSEAVKAEDADFKVQSRYMSALMLSGQLEEAAKYGDGVVENWSKIMAVGEDAYWFVNAQAFALNRAGRPVEAQALLEKLLETGFAEQPDLVSMGINYVTILLDNEEFDKTLAQIESYENDEGFSASDYGWMFLHYAKSCAMYEQGNMQEALEFYNEKTKDIAETNPAVHFLALLCLGEEDKAEAVLIKRLETKKHRGGTLPVFTTSNPRKHATKLRAKLMDKVKQVAARPKVQAVFATYGRTVDIDGPAEYWGEH